MIIHLRDGNLEKALISGRNIVQHMGLLGGDDNVYHIIYHLIKFKGFNPCLIGYISEIIFPFYGFFNCKPIRFDIIHRFGSFPGQHDLYCRPPGFTLMLLGKYLAGGLQSGRTANLVGVQYIFSADTAFSYCNIEFLIIQI